MKPKTNSKTKILTRATPVFRPVASMSAAEKQAEIHRIDPEAGRAVSTLCALLTARASMEIEEDPETVQKRKVNERLIADAQLEQLAEELGRHRTPLGLYIPPNSPDFDQRMRREVRAGGGGKFPQTLGRYEGEKPPKGEGNKKKAK